MLKKQKYTMDVWQNENISIELCTYYVLCIIKLRVMWNINSITHSYRSERRRGGGFQRDIAHLKPPFQLVSMLKVLLKEI